MKALGLSPSLSPFLNQFLRSSWCCVFMSYKTKKNQLVHVLGFITKSHQKNWPRNLLVFSLFTKFGGMRFDTSNLFSSLFTKCFGFHCDFVLPWIVEFLKEPCLSLNSLPPYRFPFNHHGVVFSKERIIHKGASSSLSSSPSSFF